MPSAIELSVRFGLPVRKITEICDYLDVDLEQEDFDIDKEFEYIARSVRRKRASSYSLAFLCAYATDEQRNFVFNLDPDFRDEYEALKLPIASDEYLAGASNLIKKLAIAEADDKAAWSKFTLWVKARIGAAGEPVNHAYLAVRLLLSLNRTEQKDYPSAIATIMNRARHRRYLDGWCTTVARNGKNIVLYHVPGIDAVTARPIKQLDISQAEIESAAALLKSRDVVRLAGLIAHEKKMEFSEVRKYLEQNMLDL